MQGNKIILLSKCVEHEFAETLFYDGVLHFDYPSKWIEKGEKGNVGQGDALEGVYSNEITSENYTKREDVDDPTIEGVKYLRSLRVVKWPCLCLFSISEQTKPVGEEGDCVEYDMSEAYAQDFSSEETWENRFKTGFPDRKAMVVIHRPQVFLDKVKRRFADFRLEEGRDYYMGCVQYRKKGEKFTYKDVPTELFHKDARFEKQQEYRIALNPRSRKVKEMLRGGQDVVLDCSLEDCAMLKSHFYKGARILVKGDEVRLEIRDWSNMSGPLHEMELKPLRAILEATFLAPKFKMEGCEVRWDEMKSKVVNVLLAKYRIVFHMEYPAMPRIIYSCWSEEEILKNEEKDSYFYVKNFKDGETGFFEGLSVAGPDGMKYYNKLTYDGEGVIGPLLQKHLKRD